MITKKYWFVLITLLCLSISIPVQAVTEVAKKKYPYILVTEDYGILNENDLASCTWGRGKLGPAFTKEGGHTSYWQCFPREQVSVTLEDTGDSPEDFKNTTVAYLSLRIFEPSGIVHEYEMRRGLELETFHKDFNRWQKLMKGEKYVCLAGDFVSIENEFAPNGKKMKVYGWIFDKLKTKKGCASYFGNCNQTYAEYLKEIGVHR